MLLGTTVILMVAETYWYPSNPANDTHGGSGGVIPASQVIEKTLLLRHEQELHVIPNGETGLGTIVLATAS